MRIIPHAFLILFMILLTYAVNSYSQEDSIEIYVIDNYVTPEIPHKLILSFFTSEACKSKININGTIDLIISNEKTDNHKIQIDLDKYNLKPKGNYFYIIVEGENGKTFNSDKDEFEIPEVVTVEGGSNFMTFCLFGGIVFALPSPTYAFTENKSYFGLTKEIPLIFLRSSGYNYPTGYFSIEYSHIINAPVKNLFRTGYKHILEIPGLEYVSPGLNYVTNFKGYNGISPELSIGLFKILNSFTVYSRYRFSAKPGDTSSEFHEISIGLYSGFFAVYL
ncbi:MAG: hypothetical protein HXY50_02540 [Ignavibacteriaceae bacterium]|nr:hypothetical protein [Ignavibacteriaceae bacterium]